MNNKIMVYEQREKSIIEYINNNTFVSNDELSKFLNVSMATIRRDIAVMEKKGLLKRSRGGIFSPNIKEYAATSSSGRPNNEKASIALYAASLINQNDSLFIGAGTTCNCLAHEIKTLNGINVTTTNLNVAMELSNCPNISVTLLGGDIATGPGFVESVLTESQLARDLAYLHFDKTFITIDGIDAEYGYTIRYKRQSPLYTQLLSSSNDFFIMADSSKFNITSFVSMFKLNEVENIITTSNIPNEYVDIYKSNNINLHIV